MNILWVSHLRLNIQLSAELWGYVFGGRPGCQGLVTGIKALIMIMEPAPFTDCLLCVSPPAGLIRLSHFPFVPPTAGQQVRSLAPGQMTEELGGNRDRGVPDSKGELLPPQTAHTLLPNLP